MATKTRSALATAGKKFRTKNISKRIQRIVISPIKEMSILADEWREKTGARIISFGQGIPFWDTPEHIKKALHKALRERDTAFYTLEPGITELRELIARFIEDEKGVRRVAAKKEIMVSVGAQEAIDCALMTVVDDGDEVLLPEPAYASHVEQILQFGGVPKFVPLDASGDMWRLDFKALEKAITKKTKAILFSNPSNPTGAVFGASEVTKLAKLAVKHDLIIISDETYDFLTYDGAKHFSPASLPWARKSVIVASSFSKKYAMTGYRIGYAYAEEGLIDHMLKAHDALAICAPAISQKAAMAALKYPQKSVKASVRQFKENRAAMCKELDGLSEFLSYKKPTGAYYILAKVLHPRVDSFKLALRILQEANVIVIPGAAFGPSGEGHIRFSYAGNPNLIHEGFVRLHAWFSKWAEGGFKL